MKKVCVFVEGQTEQIFVREFLLKWYEYQNITINCLKIMGDDTLPAEYDYPCSNASVLYQIVNVGNDNRVLSWLLKRVNGLKEEGFELIIGLRDMYSEFYRGKSKVVDCDLNNKIIASVNEHIVNELNDDSKMVSFHFAIMEIEIWMLAMQQSLLKKFPMLKIEDLCSIYELNGDIERTIYHPAATLNEVYQLAGNSYEKHKTDANSILSCMEKFDFEELLKSKLSPTFTNFVRTLLVI